LTVFCSIEQVLVTPQPDPRAPSLIVREGSDLDWEAFGVHR